MASVYPNEARIKKEAKLLVKQSQGMRHMEALDIVSRRHGFASYSVYRHHVTQERELLTPITFDDFKSELVRRGIEFSVFVPTQTGLRKSILDATGPVRLHFEGVGFHTYSTQGKGIESRVRTSGYFFETGNVRPTKMSMYRPKTKKGDPRMWFSGLPVFARPGDRVAIIIHANEPYLINISHTTALHSLLVFLDKVAAVADGAANTLIEALRQLAYEGPRRAVGRGDAAVGMTIEHALSIEPNCAKEPDYFGRIELKAARKKPVGKKTRQTLFAQVADWGHSETFFKSSNSILNRFGYDRGEDFKLYCTVSALRLNSQGLGFKISENGELLYEIHEEVGIVAVWPVALLLRRLRQKHSETFWIVVDSNTDDLGCEWFTIESVLHTKKPLETRFMELVASGQITMDHLIKRTKSGEVKEKGPLFKISPDGFRMLFPEPVEYIMPVPQVLRTGTR